jgi:PAS domain S-box-containing protein
MPSGGRLNGAADSAESDIESTPSGSVLDRITDPFVVLDKHWRFTFVNREAARLFEREPQELIGKQIFSEVAEGAKPFYPFYQQAMSQQRFIQTAEYSEHWHRWFENRIYPSPDGISILLHDITEQKAAEQAARDGFELLQAQNEVLKLIAQGQSLPATLDKLLRIVEAQSPGMLASVLLLDSEGKQIRHGAAPSLPESYNQAIDGLLIGPRAGSCGTAAYLGKPVIVEDIATDPLWTDYREIGLKHGLRACWSTPIFDEDHRVLGTFALYFRSPGLPTERHKKQIAMVTHTASIAIVKARERQSLLTANKRLSLAIAAGRIGIWERDLRTNHVVWGDRLKEMLGQPQRGEISTFDEFLDAVHADDRPALLAAINRAVSEYREYDHEYRVVWPDGSIHWIEARGKIDLDSEGQPASLRGVGLDITERKRVQEEIKAREIQLADAQRVANFGSYEWLPGTNTCRWTDELFRIFGVEPATFRPTFDGYLEHVHPEDRENTRKMIDQCVRDRTRFEMEERIVRPNGEVRWLYSRGQWLFDENQQSEKLVGTCQDITARKEAERSRSHLEDQLRQMQKMESVGRLAGGIAHDFNNLLSIIVGYAELAREASPPGSETIGHIEQIRLAAERAATLTRHLLAFSRRDVIRPAILDLNIVVRNVAKMMSRLIGENVSLHITSSPLAAKINADLGQIDQILMNLVVNAVDAMPKGGKIFIEIAHTGLDETFAGSHPSARRGEYVMLSVRDTGTGMDKDTMSQIFEPFFTTKPPGRGTGLGLSMVHGAVAHNGGYITVSSEVGKGTTFKLYFPSVDEAPQPKPPGREHVRRKTEQTILLVEDDEALCQLTAALLSGEGYKVLKARDGTSALKIAQEHSFDLVLSDVVLPDMSGVELAAELKAHRPGANVLYMSGYPGNLLSHHCVLDSGIALLSKPFTKADLISRVSASLEKAA